MWNGSVMMNVRRGDGLLLISHLAARLVCISMYKAGPGSSRKGLPQGQSQLVDLPAQPDD